MDKKKARRIDAWYVTPWNENPFCAPERAGISIVGNREGDPPDVGPIKTSKVVDADGRYVRTASGSTYLLGDADVEYLAELEANRYPFDPENPIKVVKDLTRLMFRREMN